MTFSIFNRGALALVFGAVVTPLAAQNIVVRNCSDCVNTNPNSGIYAPSSAATTSVSSATAYLKSPQQLGSELPGQTTTGEAKTAVLALLAGTSLGGANDAVRAQLLSDLAAGGSDSPAFAQSLTTLLSKASGLLSGSSVSGTAVKAAVAAFNELVSSATNAQWLSAPPPTLVALHAALTQLAGTGTSGKTT